MYIWICILGIILAYALGLGYRFYKREQVKETIRNLTSGTQEIPVEEFLSMRDAREGKKSISNQSDFTGVYIIHNVTKDMYYVGQSKTVLKRISAHLNGRGNGDVYADLKYGDEFAIKAISLIESGYNNLDALEKDTIQAYDAFEQGYNRNKGSRAC